MKKRLSVKGVNKMKLLELSKLVSNGIGKPSISSGMSYVIRNLNVPFTISKAPNVKLICVNLDENLILDLREFSTSNARSQGVIINSVVNYLLNNKSLLP